MPKIFLITNSKGKPDLPEEYKDHIVVFVVPGDEDSVPSLERYLSVDYGGTFTEEDIFITLIHPTPLSFRMENYMVPVKNTVIATDRSGIFDTLSDIEESKKNDYEFFSGKKLESQNKKIRESVFREMNNLKKLTHVFINSGYYPELVEDEKQYRIDDWMVTFEDPLQKMFVYHVSPEVSADDISIEDEFLVNPAFRTGITVYMMKVVANFMLNNKIVVFEDIEVLGTWEETKVWKRLENISIAE